MNKKTVIVLVAAVVVLIIAVFRIFGMQTEGENEVENVVSLMEKQIQDENKLEISGYTLDDPNVVLNPYEISPLTALVIFETDEEVSPEVTIHGDSDLTTYTHTFAKGTEHYLPIYGLYAGRENKVTIINVAIKRKNSRLRLMNFLTILFYQLVLKRMRVNLITICIFIRHLVLDIRRLTMLMVMLDGI